MATVKDAFAAAASLTITLASLASSGSGVGRQSTLVDNTTNLYIGALIALKIKLGTSPAVNSVVSVYLIRSDNSNVADDGAGTTDAGLTVTNAPLLGQIVVPSGAVTGTVIYGIFDTRPLGSLGPKWGIAVVNQATAALDATEANHTKEYVGINQTVA